MNLTTTELQRIRQGLEADSVTLWKSLDGRYSISYTQSEFGDEPVEPFGIERYMGAPRLVDLDTPDYSMSQWWSDHKAGRLTALVTV